MVHISVRVRWSLIHGCRLAWRGGLCWPILVLLLTLFFAWHLTIAGVILGEKYREFLHSHSEVLLTMREDVSDQKRQEFFSALQELSFVNRATYITREKAINRMRSTRPDVLGALEGVSDLRQVPDIIAVRLLSLQAEALLDAFLLDGPWQRVIHPGVFVHGTNDIVNGILHAGIVYGALVGMILILCALGVLFIVCMAGILMGDVYQLPLRMRIVRQSGRDGFYGALSSIVGLSLWGIVASVGSWILLALLAWALSLPLLRLPIFSTDVWYTLFVIGTGEILLLPVAIGLIGLGLIRLHIKE